MDAGERQKLVGRLRAQNLTVRTIPFNDRKSNCSFTDNFRIRHAFRTQHKGLKISAQKFFYLRRISTGTAQP